MSYNSTCVDIQIWKASTIYRMSHIIQVVQFEPHPKLSPTLTRSREKKVVYANIAYSQADSASRQVIVATGLSYFLLVCLQFLKPRRLWVESL